MARGLQGGRGIGWCSLSIRDYFKDMVAPWLVTDCTCIGDKSHGWGMAWPFSLMAGVVDGACFVCLPALAILKVI